MLSLSDIAAVGRSRFYEKEGKYADWAFRGFAVYLILVIVAIVIVMATTAPQSSVFAIIPSQCIVVGEDVIIRSVPFNGLTVNGYLLDEMPVNLTLVWVYFALLMPPFICLAIFQAISNYRRGKYVDEFLEKYKAGDIPTVENHNNGGTK
jgi:hypothetical protein